MSETISVGEGLVTSVGSTVDVPNTTYTNSIGDAMLTAHRKDPELDPKQRALYYVRVIEIPKEVTMTAQDRAYTSPIWYTP